MPAAPESAAAATVLAEAMRHDRGRLIAALIARLRDFQLAEEALQEAAVSALAHWGRSGPPTSPQGWLLKVAMRKAIDRLRSGVREDRKAADLARLVQDEADDTVPMMIPDDQLRLIFTCCHPALDQKSRVALTLRTIGGLTTAEIARAFLDSEPTMGQRLSRAKAKIAAAGIPFRLPEAEDFPDRLDSVLTVLYLIFNAGYTLGPAQDRDLCDEAIYLARLVDSLRPDEPEIEGALALLLITHSRRAARIKDGVTVPLADQDRARWDLQALDEGRKHLMQALNRHRPGPFQIKAAIAACQAETPPDWPQIAAHYDALHTFEPTPVIRLNQAVALAESGELRQALDRMAALAGKLEDYQPYHAARAEYLARDGQTAAALSAYAAAITLAPSAADAAFLTQRRDRLRQ